MPSILPPPFASSSGDMLSSLPPELQDIVQSLSRIPDQLALPTWTEYSSALVEAARHAKLVAVSIGWVLYLTFRPPCILLYLCTHGVLTYIIQPCIHQAYHYQRSLTTAQIFVEGGMISALIFLFLLRRFIRQRQYVERTSAWYRNKQQRVVDRFQSFLNRVAETSLFLAYVVPHVMYFASVALLQWTSWGRWVIRAVATETIMTDLLSLWIPVARSVYVVGRWKYLRFHKLDKDIPCSKGAAKTATLTNAENTLKSTQSKKEGAVRRDDSETSLGGKGQVERGDNRKRSMPHDEKNVTSNSKAAKTKAAKTEGTKGTETSSAELSPLKNSIRSQAEETDPNATIVAGGMNALKYWIVYSLAIAFFEMVRLVPFLGTVVLPDNQFVGDAAILIDEETPAKNMIVGLLHAIHAWWSDRSLHAQEWKFVLVLWVWLFQGLRTSGGLEVYDAADCHDGDSVERLTRYNASPLDALYDNLSIMMKPIYGTASTMESRSLSAATSLQSASKKDIAGQAPYANKIGLTYTILSKIDAFLSVAVLVRLITKSTKTSLLRGMCDGTDFVPAAITVFMPTYFARWGCIFAGCIVPAGYGMQCYDDYRQSYCKRVVTGKGEKAEENDTVAAMNFLEGELVRHLQYWIIYHVVIRSILLSRRNPVGAILFWMPYSVNLTLLVILVLQLANGADSIYRGIEYELVAFNILNPHFSSISCEKVADRNLDVSQTTTMKILTKVRSSIRSSALVEEKPCKDNEELMGTELSGNKSRSVRGDDEKNDISSFSVVDAVPDSAKAVD